MASTLQSALELLRLNDYTARKVTCGLCRRLILDHVVMTVSAIGYDYSEQYISMPNLLSHDYLISAVLTFSREVPFPLAAVTS